MAITKPTPRTIPQAHSRAGWLHYVKRSWPLYAMMLPCLMILAVFHYYPMYGLVIAFQKYNPGLGFTGSPWVGLANFERLFSTPSFWQLFRNTLVIAVGKLVSVQTAAVVLALLLNEVHSVLFKRTVQTLVYLPHFLSWIVLGGILVDVLSAQGLVNRLLSVFGVGPFLFLGNNSLFQPVLITTNLWKEVGWSAIIYLAALTSIDPALYEAAALDGANRWKQTLHVTLPSIRFVVIVVAALSLGSVLNAGFEQVLTLSNPAVYATGEILDTYVYRTGLISAQFSLASAVGLLSSCLSFVLIMLGYWLAAKWADYRIF